MTVLSQDAASAVADQYAIDAAFGGSMVLRSSSPGTFTEEILRQQVHLMRNNYPRARVWTSSDLPAVIPIFVVQSRMQDRRMVSWAAVAGTLKCRCGRLRSASSAVAGSGSANRREGGATREPFCVCDISSAPPWASISSR